MSWFFFLLLLRISQQSITGAPTTALFYPHASVVNISTSIGGWGDRADDLARPVVDIAELMRPATVEIIAVAGSQYAPLGIDGNLDGPGDHDPGLLGRMREGRSRIGAGRVGFMQHQQMP